MTLNYIRNGMITLFAALNTLDGNVISLCQECHRHKDWRRFLRLFDDATPPEKALLRGHSVLDALYQQNTSGVGLERVPRHRLNHNRSGR